MYLLAVRNLHVKAGLHSEFAAQLTPRLEMVLRGIKDKSSTAPRPRLPITIKIMRKIKETFSLSPSDHDNIMMWAVCALAFFGFLRCSEFTVPNQEDYCPDTHLSPQDLPLIVRHLQL